MLDELKRDRLSQFLIILIFAILIFGCIAFGWLVYSRLSPNILPSIISTASLASPIGNNLTVKSSQTDITANHLKIWGEVENTGAYTCPFVEISVSYYDNSDKLIVSDSNYLDNRSLAPDESSPFTITTPRPAGSSVPARFDINLSNTIGCLRAN